MQRPRLAYRPVIFATSYELRVHGSGKINDRHVELRIMSPELENPRLIDPDCERVTKRSLSLNRIRLPSSDDSGECEFLTLPPRHGRILPKKGADCIIEIIIIYHCVEKVADEQVEKPEWTGRWNRN